MSLLLYLFQWAWPLAAKTWIFTSFVDRGPNVIIQWLGVEFTHATFVLLSCSA